jgi:hypothetical protein
VSVVADPPRADPGTRCPRCGAELAPEQDWCLQCGAAARTRIVPPPSWRGPVAIVATIVLLAGAGIALAFVEVTDQGQQPTSSAAAATTPAAPATPPAAQTTTPAAPATPPAAQTTTPATPATTTGAKPSSNATPALLTWPKGKAAYTVILLSTADHAAARKTAKALAKAAPVVGLARSADFSNVPAGSWLVFAGRYKDHAKAVTAAAAAKQHGATGAYVQYLTAR